MKQILQNFSTGTTDLVDAPAPTPRNGRLLIDSSVSLISTGTERMLVDFGKASMVSKARQQPEKVRQVVDKIATDGLLTTVDAVRSKLSEPIALGYCNVGRVRHSGVAGFEEGNRVVSNGAHADVVSVPGNLAARIPDGVDDETAAFTVVASIGLQGMRLAQPTLGESFAVTGVGLIGLLTVQLLRAQGCRVLAIDFDPEKLALAAHFGAETCNPASGQDPVKAGLTFSRGAGVDGVIVTASTKSSDPIQQAAQMCRQRGRIVLVGVTGLELNRADFYQKELSFQVSCSYGPGRYDTTYEEGGQDYPIGFVRWTEQRNFEAVLDLMASGAIDTSALVKQRFAFADAPAAYATLSEDKSALGLMLTYDHDIEPRHVKTIATGGKLTTVQADPASPSVGMIGAGNYASRVLIPAFQAAHARLHTLASNGGTSAAVHGKKFSFEQATSDNAVIFENDDINTVVIATRHNTHAPLTCQALTADKHAFVEKPLALNREDLQMVQTDYEQAGRHLMVGFNRRFAPHVVKMKDLLAPVSAPKSFVMIMNAGAIPADHWTQDPDLGGGRIIGEACHYIDLMRFLAGSQITSVQARQMGDTEAEAITEDKAVIVLGFADGSFGTIHYLANGSSTFPKERIEVFAEGKTLQLNNFKQLTGFNWPGFKSMKLWRQNKGQNECVKAFLDAVATGGPSPIPVEELFEVAGVTLDATDQLRSQR